MFPACSTGFPTIGMSSEMTNPAYLQFNPVQQVVACCGLDMGMNTPDMALRRTISTPASIPETYLDTSCFAVIASTLLCFNALLSVSSNSVSLYKLYQTCLQQLQPSSTWDADAQNLFKLEFHQGRSISFPSQPFTGR